MEEAYGIRRFQPERDLERLEAYLRQRWQESRKPVSWLPQRLHDLYYRMSAMEADEGRPRSADYIFLWERGGEIAACLLPDGENVYFSQKPGHEALFPAMLAFAEQNCLPLFRQAEDGRVKFWAAVSDGIPGARQLLEARGYQPFPEKEYMSGAGPLLPGQELSLPKGFRLLCGEDWPDEAEKWSALRLGFHPELEGTDYRAPMGPYLARKGSSLYPDSFECLVVTDNAAEANRVCAYCFVYVDRQSGTALIEPVSTREPYQHRGFGRAMMQAALRRCAALGLEKCYVDSFGWRREFYAAAGFAAEDSVSFWSRMLPADLAQLGFCGVDCGACPDFSSGKCPGCRKSQWPPEDPCPPVGCCREKNISCCGDCRDFPCRMMADFYAESDSHRAALARMKDLAAPHKKA